MKRVSQKPVDLFNSFNLQKNSFRLKKKNVKFNRKQSVAFNPFSRQSFQNPNKQIVPLIQQQKDGDINITKQNQLCKNSNPQRLNLHRQISIIPNTISFSSLKQNSNTIDSINQLLKTIQTPNQFQFSSLILNMFQSILKPLNRNILSTHSIYTEDSCKNRFNNNELQESIFEQIEKEKEKVNQIRNKKSLSLQHRLCKKIVKRLDQEYKFDQKSNQIRFLCKNIQHTRFTNDFKLNQNNKKSLNDKGKSKSQFQNKKNTFNDENQYQFTNSNVKSFDMRKNKSINLNKSQLKLNRKIIQKCKQVQNQNQKLIKKPFQMFRKFDDLFKKRCSKSKQFLQQFKRLI